MSSTKPQHVFRFTTSTALQDAMRSYCDKRGITPSELARLAIANHIGKPKLAETVKIGRPVIPEKS